MVDANAGDSGDIKKMDVIVSVNYDYNPSASNPAFQETLMGQYTINDPNAAGPCSFLFNAPQTAVADGVSSVNVNILSVTDQANAAVPDNTPITLTTDKGKFSNNRTEIAVLTKKDTVTGNANASAVLMVGSEPGVANLTASYTCGSISVKRYAQILLLDQSQVGKPSISVFSALPKLLTDGTSKVAINAFVYQANGNPVPDGTSVGFTTTRSTLTAPTAFTTGGKATVYLNAGNAPGIAIITASYQPPTGDPITATTQVQLVSLGSIQFVKADPSILGVKNSGFNESSSIQFKVLDNLGQPFQAQYPVKFSVSTAPGGVYLLVTDGFTESDGVTSTVLVTGTVATTITVSAKATLGTTTLTGVSSSIPIIGAKPSAKYFQLNPPTAGDKIQTVANFDEAYIQQDYNFKAYLGDRYSNIIAKQTTVHFRSEAGTITPEALSVEAKATGVLRKMAPYPKDVAPYCLDQAGKYDENKCNNPTTPIPNAVYYEPWYRIQGDPLYDPKHFYNPRDGFVTVIAVTTGEEEFDDDDGNGDFSPSDAYRVPRDDLKTGNAKCTAQLGSGNEEVCSWMNFNSNTLACSGSWDYYNPLTFHKSESFVDLSEPFVDMNDNGVWDAGEPFFDTNQNGVWDSGNGLWDNNTNIWTEGYQLWTRSYNTPEWNQTGSCNLSSFVDNIQTGVYSRNWLCSDQAFTMQRGTPTDQLTFNGRFCDLNLNSFFSERIGGLSGLWTTAPGVKMLDAQGNVVTVPITQVSNSDPFPLESKDSVLIKWKKDWADPIKGYEEIWIGTDSSWDYCWANRDYKKTKSFIVKSGCQENTTQLVGVAPTSYTQQTSTFIRLDVVDSGSNVVKAIKQVTGTWIP
jgi:hypothetical protein